MIFFVAFFFIFETLFRWVEPYYYHIPGVTMGYLGDVDPLTFGSFGGFGRSPGHFFFALLRRNVPNPLGVRMPTMMAWTTASCRWWPPLRRSNGSNGPGETSWWRMNGFYKTIIDRILINASHCIYIYRLKKSTRFRWGLVLFLVATLRTCSLRQLQPSLTRPWRWRLLRWPARCCAFLMDGNGWEDVVFLDVNHITLW